MLKKTNNITKNNEKKSKAFWPLENHTVQIIGVFFLLFIRACKIYNEQSRYRVNGNMAIFNFVIKFHMKKKHGGMLSDAGQTRLAFATANGIYIDKFNTCSRRVNGRD